LSEYTLLLKKLQNILTSTINNRVIRALLMVKKS